MRVAVGAMLRDASPYLDRYLTQLHGLKDLLARRGDEMRCIWLENDSQDDTMRRLEDQAGAFNASLLSVQTGERYYPSSEIPARWAHIARLCNRVLAEVDPDRDDIFLYVECDLIWDPRTLLNLVTTAEDRGIAVGACNVRGGNYYDIWGTRLVDGTRFRIPWPWAPGIPEHGLLEVGSAAGCTALPASVVPRTSFSAAEAYVGWCASIRSVLGAFWLDLDSRVVHP